MNLWVVSQTTSWNCHVVILSGGQASDQTTKSVMWSYAIASIPRGNDAALGQKNGNFLITKNPKVLNELENLFNSVSRGKESYTITNKEKKEPEGATKENSFDDAAENVNNLFYLLIAHFHMFWQENGGNRSADMFGSCL